MKKTRTFFKSLICGLIILTLTLQSHQVSAQKDIKGGAVSMPMLSFNYGFFTPGGDMAKRFGNNSSIGSIFLHKTAKNYIFGAEGNFIFGRNVRENTILDQIASEDGEVLDKDGQISTILFFERGYTISLSAGKIFPIFGPNENSGLMIRAGVGFIQHKIRIEHQNNRIPQLDGDYYKGYDRLSNGLMTNQFIGYMNMSNTRMANFYIGFEAIQGYTQSRREYNFDTRTKDTAKRLDLLYGVKVGFCVLFYKRTSSAYYIN